MVNKLPLKSILCVKVAASQAVAPLRGRFRVLRPVVLPERTGCAPEWASGQCNAMRGRRCAAQVRSS
jgi:hypothetical protein